MTPSRDVLRGGVTVRRADAHDVDGIAALVADWSAAEALLPRSASEIALAVDDYVVAVDGADRVVACAALRAYSPSLAELSSVAVARSAHGRGLGRLVVAEMEKLAAARGYASVFAHTCEPAFFRAVGYDEVDRALYPEKVARAHTRCFRRSLGAEVPLSVAA